MVEQKVNAIIAELIRVLGPNLLRNFLGNNQPGSNGGLSTDGATATAASPFGDDDEDDDGDDYKSTSANGSKVSISLPTYPPDEDEESGSTTTEPSSAGGATSGGGLDATNTVA